MRMKPSKQSGPGRKRQQESCAHERLSPSPKEIVTQSLNAIHSLIVASPFLPPLTLPLTLTLCLFLSLSLAHSAFLAAVGFIFVFFFAVPANSFEMSFAFWTQFV